ncbi:WD40 repeat domain-containing protein [Paenibacillus sp. UNC499MF]|uniref:WD40 repeat domain-containing protein n=1 Tax=Paenibacillus sp. UNC499MF TaxID=1502751 RepID=UPI0008A01552|nr:WD40 repeat domain-containing protein [Paenibacillus sp. UNC499MF]SEF65711.1 hypothetical protein SAMN02799616_00778 [Paenibacillus sp. UNC499MF]
MFLLAAAPGCERSPSPSVTVVDPPAAENSGDTVLAGIRHLDKFYAMGWSPLGELIGIPGASPVGAPLEFRNLTGDKIRDTGIKGATGVQMSPDGKNAWVYHRYEGTADLYQLETGRVIRIGPQTREFLGAWIDDKSYLAGLTEPNNRLVRFGTDGEMTPVEHEDVPSGIVRASIKDGRLYVLSGDRELTVTETGGGSSRIWSRSGVADFAVSPGGQRIALVTVTGPDQNALVLADAARGGSEKPAARGRLLQQLSWSPDGSRLAFSVFSPDQGMTGLYVMNAASGRMVPVSYKPNLKSIIEWSPSGTSFTVSEFLSGEITDRLFTTLYQLK